MPVELSSVKRAMADLQEIVRGGDCTAVFAVAVRVVGDDRLNIIPIVAMDGISTAATEAAVNTLVACVQSTIEESDAKAAARGGDRTDA